MFQTDLTYVQHQRPQAHTVNGRGLSVISPQMWRHKDRDDPFPSDALKCSWHSSSIVNDIIASFSPPPWKRIVHLHRASPAHTSQNNSLQKVHSSNGPLEIEAGKLKKILDAIHRENVYLEKERRRLQEQLEELFLSVAHKNKQRATQ